MSKAFTRESDQLPESRRLKSTSALPPGVKNYFTPDGVNRPREERQALNSRTASPADRQRIYEIEQSLRSAVVVEPPSQPWRQVAFGATVTVRAQDNARQIYRIVGVDETDFNSDHISWLSPIARALLKKSIGERVRFHTPDGEQVLEIQDVTFKGENPS